MLCFSFGMGPKIGVNSSNINSRHSLFHFVKIHDGIVHERWAVRFILEKGSGLSNRAQDDRTRHMTRRGFWRAASALPCSVPTTSSEFINLSAHTCLCTLCVSLYYPVFPLILKAPTYPRNLGNSQRYTLKSWWLWVQQRSFNLVKP